MSALRRRPDGKPEFRSLDDLLAEAARDDVVQRLPGKGRPLDLDGYLRADPESRVAHKLLSDHHVIPQPLQDRRDAERWVETAEQAAAAAADDQARRRLEVESLRRQLAAAWPAGVEPATVFAPDPAPAWLASQPGDAPADAVDLARRLEAATSDCVRRRAVARRQLEEALAASAALTRRLNEQVVLSRTLPAGLQMTPVKVEARLAQFDADCPDLEPLPPDLAPRLRQAVRAARPSWWRRLL